MVLCINLARLCDCQMDVHIKQNDDSSGKGLNQQQQYVEVLIHQPLV